MLKSEANIQYKHSKYLINDGFLHLSCAYKSRDLKGTLCFRNMKLNIFFGMLSLKHMSNYFDVINQRARIIILTLPTF